VNETLARYIEVLEKADPVALGHALTAIAERRPNEALVVSLRVALEMADMRRTHRQDMAHAGSEIASAVDWRRFADAHIPYEELKRRRAA
jgi:hypothetical protein